MTLPRALSPCPAAARPAPRAAADGALPPALARDREAASDRADRLGRRWRPAGLRRAGGRHLPRLYGLAHRITGSAAEAEDVAQEALLRAWQKAGQFDPERARFATWLHRIASNLAIDHCRRRGAAAPLPLAEHWPDPASGPEQALQERQRRAGLERALAELPPRQRAALALAHDQGLSGAEAAAVLATSERAVEGLLHRARRFLAARLRGEGA
ncbi:sigma-70 family RNA polymerase sigma factor [Pseudoroseomonas cervicalis]